jgi:hypothetical protein
VRLRRGGLTKGGLKPDRRQSTPAAIFLKLVWRLRATG